MHASAGAVGSAMAIVRQHPHRLYPLLDAQGAFVGTNKLVVTDEERRVLGIVTVMDLATATRAHAGKTSCHKYLE